jgi:plastocyanin
MSPVFRLILCLSVVFATALASPAASNYVVRARVQGGVLWVFSPTNLVIAVGDTVTWTNAHGATAHDTTAGPANSGTNNGWASPLLTNNTGQTFPFTFSVPGNYPYRCRTHVDSGAISPHPEQTGSVSVVGMNFAPIISLTNPPAGGAAVAPAAVLLQASASDGDGSVTNVQFLSNGSPLGSVTTAPFELLTGSLAAGNYSFTAIATDNSGLSATSAPVPFFLLTNAVLTNVALSNGSARLTVHGIAGQTYILDATTNLALPDWQALATNVAPANVFEMVDSNAAAFPQRSYRGRQVAP